MLRLWPGFESSAHGPLDHVIRNLPRDWRIFERMRPGDEYPDAHRIAEALLRDALDARRERGEPVYPQELRRRIVPPYRVDGFPNKWWKLLRGTPARTRSVWLDHMLSTFCSTTLSL
jgi:DNA (cytosine-5)-methyltransferase 1